MRSRSQRGQGAGAHGSRLRCRGRQENRGQEGTQKQPPHRVRRDGAVLDQHAGSQRSEGQTHGARVACHQRREAPGRAQVQQRGAECAGRQADGYPLQRPCGKQRTDPVRQQEKDARRRIRGKGGDDHRPASHMVGQGAEDQHRRQEEQHVDGEHCGERGRREPPPGLVDAIQRGRRGGRGEEQDQHGCLQPERGRSRLLWPPGSLCPGPR
jgi:hypothetical protein